MLPGGGHVYDVFYSESGLELNPEVVTLTPGIPCIWYIWYTWYMPNDSDYWCKPVSKLLGGMCVLVSIAALFASKKLPPGMSVTFFCQAVF